MTEQFAGVLAGIEDMEDPAVIYLSMDDDTLLVTIKGIDGSEEALSYLFQDTQKATLTLTRPTARLLGEAILSWADKDD